MIGLQTKSSDEAWQRRGDPKDSQREPKLPECIKSAQRCCKSLHLHIHLRHHLQASIEVHVCPKCVQSQFRLHPKPISVAAEIPSIIIFRGRATFDDETIVCSSFVVARDVRRNQSSKDIDYRQRGPRRDFHSAIQELGTIPARHCTSP